MYDSGAYVSIINQNQINKLNIQNKDIQKQQQTMIMANKHKEETVGRATVSLIIGKLNKFADFQIVQNSTHDVIIGLNTIYQFNLGQDENGTIFQKLNTVFHTNNITTEKDLTSTTSIEKLTEKYNSIFAKNNSDIGRVTNEICRIQLLDDTPINLRPYRHSDADNQTINKITEELLQTGLISRSSSAYSFPVILTNKKDDGQKTRLCVDYRKLNKITITESYPYPLIADLIDRTLNCGIFTTLDVKSGFHHVPIQENDRHKTAFTTQTGTYHWNVMPFGLKNGPAIFQRTLHRILIKHNLTSFSSNYIDDILIFSKNIDEHLRHLEMVFKALQIENIKLKLSKCQFAQSKVEYLGHTISLNEIKPLQSNIDAIMAIKPPTNQKEIQRFVGHIQYYREFIPNCSKLIAPLTKLLKKDEKFEWQNEQQECFEKVRNLLSQKPILTIFDPEKPIHLFTDASKDGLGAILKQQEKDKLLPIAYFSKSLQPYQQNYAIPELECLAIIEAFRHWHHYLDGRFTNIHSDHAGLQWLDKVKLSKSRLARWSLELSQYDHQIIYEPGKNNIEADQLSRNPVQINNYYLSDDQIREKIRDENNNLILTNKVPIYCQIDNNTVKYEGKEFIPPPIRKEIIDHFHQDLGHLSANKTVYHISKNYKWPRINEETYAQIRKCEVCIKNKTRPPNKQGHFDITLTSKPYELIQIDSIGGMNQEGTTKRYLHIAIDMFSRKMWHISSKSQKTVDFVNLINKIRNEQTPDCIRSDNYPALRSRCFRRYLENCGIKYETTPAYSPQSIGIVERANSTIVNQIRTMVNNPQVSIKWPKIAAKAVEIYNDTKHSSTGYAPNEIIQNDQVHEEVKNSDFQSRTRNQNRINRNRITNELELGDQVLALNQAEPNRSKLEPIFIGPFEIIEKLSDTRYKLSNNTTHSSRNLIKIQAINGGGCE